MPKLILNLEGPDGPKLKRAFEAFCLQQDQTAEEVLMPTLRGIAQQMGVDANDDEADQEASLSKAERKGAKAKTEREARATEAIRLQAESDQRRADEAQKTESVKE